MQCSSSAHCSDGLFCNGAEFCSAGDCFPGSNPCPGQGCNETTDVCTTGTQSAAGRVPSAGGSPLRLQKAGSNVTLTWGTSCLGTDTDYAVYEGTVGGTFTSHASRLCSTGGLTTASFAPAAGNRYYLVVPRNASREGSYGTQDGRRRASGGDRSSARRSTSGAARRPNAGDPPRSLRSATRFSCPQHT